MTVAEICQRCGKLAFPGETITITRQEYEDLQQFKAARTEIQGALSPIRLKGHSRIARDPDLAEFIIASAATMLVREVHEACEKRFGAVRTPHRTTIGRFIQSHGSGGV